MLDDRKKKILKAVVEEYVATAEPVGSKSIADLFGQTFSSATIRNEMAEMEERGYLEKPHTSSGRIPSHKGYRLYVNDLMNDHKLSVSEQGKLNAALTVRLQEFDRVMHEASRMLSEITHYATAALTPGMTGCEIHRIEIINCAAQSYVLVLVTATGIVRNKICRLTSECSPETVKSLCEALNDELHGVEASRITLYNITRIERREPAAGELLDAVMVFLKEVMEEVSTSEYHFDGANYLLSNPEYRDVDKARKMLDFLNDTNDISWLALPSDGTTEIKIGAENSAEQLSESSIIIANCNLAGNTKAKIALIGPTRMDYSRLTARVRFFTAGLNRLIREILIDNGSDDLSPPGNDDFP